MLSIKLHQIFGLVDMDYSKLAKGRKELFDAGLASMKKCEGLNYLARNRTPAGRTFEHASDCRSIFKAIMLAKPKPAQEMKVDFTVTLEGDGDNLHLDKELVDLSMTAQGKVDLYFHAYVVSTLFRFLFAADDASFEKEVEANEQLRHPRQPDCEPQKGPPVAAARSFHVEGLRRVRRRVRKAKEH